MLEDRAAIANPAPAFIRGAEAVVFLDVGHGLAPEGIAAKGQGAPVIRKVLHIYFSRQSLGWREPSMQLNRWPGSPLSWPLRAFVLRASLLPGSGPIVSSRSAENPTLKTPRLQSEQPESRADQG